MDVIKMSCQSSRHQIVHVHIKSHVEQRVIAKICKEKSDSHGGIDGVIESEFNQW